MFYDTSFFFSANQDEVGVRWVVLAQSCNASSPSSRYLIAVKVIHKYPRERGSGSAMNFLAVYLQMKSPFGTS
jgi:hypothetical protein